MFAALGPFEILILATLVLAAIAITVVIAVARLVSRGRNSARAEADRNESGPGIRGS